MSNDNAMSSLPQNHPLSIVKRWQHFRDSLQGDLTERSKFYIYCFSGGQLREEFDHIVEFIRRNPEYKEIVLWVISNEPIYKKVCDERRITWTPLPDISELIG